MKKIKKLLKTSLLVAIVPTTLLLITSCSNNDSPTKSFAELVVSDDTATLKDKSFSETTYNGWYQFMTSSKVTNKFSNTNEYDKETFDMPNINSNNRDLDLGKGYWRRPVNSNRENTFRQIFNGGANLIIAPGFNHKDAVEKVANQMKDKGFILLDSDVDTTKGDFTNVASFTFRAEQSGFLAGIATAEFLNMNKDIFANKDKGDNELKVGGFVGQAIPTTTDFLAGFQSGIIAYNIKINNENPKQKMPIKWANLGNDISSYSSNSFSAGEGRQIALELLVKEEVDAIIPIAGPQTRDAISIILENNRPAIVIGVDSEQEINDDIQNQLQKKHLEDKVLKNANGEPLGNSNILQFSAIKKLDEAVYRVLVSIFNENNPNNELENNDNNIPVYGFGYNNFGTLANETVGVSKAGLEWIKLFDENWVTSSNDILLFNSDGGIYDNSIYNLLEDKGLMYLDDISVIKNVSELDNKNHVSSNVFPYGDNRLVSKLLDKSPKPSLNKNEKSISLNGSIWSLQKGKLKSQNYYSLEPKKYLV